MKRELLLSVLPGLVVVAVPPGAGIVHKNINPAESLNRCFYNPLDIVLLCHVCHQRQALFGGDSQRGRRRGPYLLHQPGDTART